MHCRANEPLRSGSDFDSMSGSAAPVADFDVASPTPQTTGTRRGHGDPMIHDQDGRLKRIEYRGKYLRESRTGGVSLRAQTKLAGLNLTANAQHGFRVSTRVAKGTNAGFQNGRFVLRGRYGKGRTKLNLSKSGVSVSSKTSVGTINWFKPRYSSAKIAGIQVRGQNALYINILASLIQMAFVLLLAAIQLIVWLLQAGAWGIAWAFASAQAWWMQRRIDRIVGVETAWEEHWSDEEATGLFAGMAHIMFHLAAGSGARNANEDGFLDALFTDEWAAVLEVDGDPERVRPIERRSVERVESLLERGGLPPILLMETAFGSLVSLFIRNASAPIVLDAFLFFDDAIVTNGTRTQLQEMLLGVFGHTAGIVAEPGERSSAPGDHGGDPSGAATIDAARAPTAQRWRAIALMIFVGAAVFVGLFVTV